MLRQLQSSPARLLTILLTAAVLFAIAGSSATAAVYRVMLEPGVVANLRDGTRIILECRPPAGDAGRELLQKYLAKGESWDVYVGKGAVAIMFEKLNSQAQRTVLLSLFPADIVDADGWVHEVRYADDTNGRESLWSLCEWLTGSGASYKRVMSHNDLKTSDLAAGQIIRFPLDMLRPALRAFTATALDSSPPVNLEAAAEQLTYGKDEQGEYAVYRLKPGEALYSSVVMRFTDYSENEQIWQAVRIIQERNKIPDLRDIDAHTRIIIPMEMLSNRFKPEGSEGRKAYEAMLAEADRLGKERVTTRDLEGIVVILDPGHGGEDPGKMLPSYRLYEDELNYDVACRVKHILETETAARVHVTTMDRSLGYKAVTREAFTHDKDEELLTSPRFRSLRADKTSINLRWMLVNSIYREEIARGADPRKIIFTSFHVDSLSPRIRGTMVYIPGSSSQLRNSEAHAQAVYCRHFQDSRERSFSCTASERTRDEALSMNFARTLLKALGDHRPALKRHDMSPPIRNRIRRNGRQYLPAVLRNNEVPTKVLVEMANIENARDRLHLSNYKWRQWYAEAYVDALKVYFGS